ncbi:alpha-tocopherol transfer protein-like isoform X2 [Stomoxys calcitrans]|uniref:CRAL-TRIO domain-containing protein n=1 Tax=Stomoxys calcitrans TaxID=35570 RepID=A0A1I8Q7W2_STOCA|nr:alpha-tocopherol transfer protein-like isoform X2 [Stomoxys calcitrans]
MANIRPLNEDLQKSAAELGEVPSRLEEDLAALKEWIKQQPHLRANTDDQFLVAFLRGCKYSLEKAKAKIDKFYTLKSKFPDVFSATNVDDAKFRELIRLGIWLYLPTPLNENGPRICIMRNGLHSSDKYSGEEVLQMFHAQQEIMILEDDYATINGIVFIGDFEKATLAHFFQVTPSLSKKMTVFAEEAIPLRPKASHFVNTPMGFETIFNIIKPMLSAKQQSRLFVHGNKMDSLIQQVPLKYLPKEYGGENGSLDEISKEWEQKLDKYREYFKKNAEYGTDEKLRPGKAIDFNSIFGIDGSFRKLDVD